MSDRFPWLHGQPYSTRDLRWPPDAESLLEQSGRSGARLRMSILDDRWAYLAHPKASVAPTSNESWVYSADLAPEATAGTDIIIERVAVLRYRVDLLSLCPRGARAAFVTLKWDQIALSIVLTAHALDGHSLATRTIPAHAAYGRIVVDGTRAAVCLSSGRPPEDSSCGGWPWPRHRVRPPPPAAESALLFGDQIAVWDWEADALEVVDLMLPHQASFSFLPFGGLALVALSPPDRGHPYPVLQVIPLPSTQAGDAARAPIPALLFTEGVHKSQEIDTTLAQVGSSAPSELIAHVYHSGGRLAIFSQRILTTDVEPTTDDPPGLIATRLLPADVRTLRLRLAGSATLPVQVGTRLLVTRDPDDPSTDDEDEAAEYEEDDEEDAEERAAPLWILDFDPDRLRQLTALTPDERDSLSSELARGGAEVKVVTRQFHLDFEGGEMELEPERDIHAGSSAAARKTLVYDESTAPPRDDGHVGSGCTRTKLALPASGSLPGQEYADLALTTSGVLRVPEPAVGKAGCMYYFRF